MDKEISTFGNNEFAKIYFCHNKTHIFLKYLDNEKVLLSNKIFLVKKP